LTVDESPQPFAAAAKPSATHSESTRFIVESPKIRATWPLADHPRAVFAAEFWDYL